MKKSIYTCSLIFVTTWMAASAGASMGTETPVNLGTAGNFAILSKSGISNSGVTSVVGDLGVSPIDSTAITGFSLSLDATQAFSTSSSVTGKVYASNYAAPTPANMTTAISDVELAYADASGRSSGDAVTELGAGNISGLTLEPGLYRWGTGLLINTDVALSGPSNGVWIFQIAQDLTVGSGAAIILSGGAQASRIFWQVGGEVNLGTTSHLEGIVLSKTAIHLNSGASINGSLLAQTAVTLKSSTVTRMTVTSETPLHWFGSFTDHRADPEAPDGWIQHCEHGWLYKIEAERGIWVWDRAQQDWLWTSEAAYPYLYSIGLDNWIFYVKGGKPALRWFFFYDDQNADKGEWDYVQDI